MQSPPELENKVAQKLTGEAERGRGGDRKMKPAHAAHFYFIYFFFFLAGLSVVTFSDD